MDQCKVTLMTMTDDALNTVVTAILACRNAGSFEELSDVIEKTMSYDDKIHLVHRVMKMGHMSVIEHVSLTFLIENISRSCSHQIVRHRLASISQESQRTVNVASMVPIMPDSIKNSVYRSNRYNYLINECVEAYQDLIDDGTPLEDVRYVLPNATPTKLVMTFNAREMYHLFDMRLCLCAEDEIRSIVEKMRELVQKTSPLFPEDMIGPSCLSERKCSQGKRGCRRYLEIEKTGKATR